MRHRVAGKKLNRTPAHRQATLRNLAAGLFEHGQIETTMPKAKAVQPFVERLITIAKRGDLHSRRLVQSRLGGDRRAFVWLTEERVATYKRENPFFDVPDADEIEFNRYGEVRKAPSLVKHICENVAPRYKDRPGGYTRIIKLGTSRLGDGGEKVILQLVGEEEGPELGGQLSRRREIADRRTAYAASLHTGAGDEEASAVATEEPPAEEQPEAPAAEGPAEEPQASENAGEESSEEKKEE
jgi:large subunit ribosomal protein L17